MTNTGDEGVREIDLVAHESINGLRKAFPGIVEEWERQQADEQAHGSDNWPGFESAEDLLWWFAREVELARDFSKNNQSRVEAGIGEYCGTAAEKLRRIMELP